MNKITKLLTSIGLYDKGIPRISAPDPVVYAGSSEEIASAHMSYLKSLDDDENKRLDLIEGKTSQLVSQTGVIFSLLSLFVPLLFDKVSDANPYIKASLIFLMVLSFLFYMLTIRNALKNYNVANFRYASPASKNVIDFQDKELILFYSEVIRDLMYSLKVNSDLNDLKATNLLHSYTSFRAANVVTALLVFSFCTFIFTTKQQPPSVSILGPVKFEAKSLPNVIEAKPAIVIGDTNRIIKKIDVIDSAKKRIQSTKH